MKRALQFGVAATLVVFGAIAVDGIRNPAFAEFGSCHYGTPQVCWVNEVCNEWGYEWGGWPPILKRVCQTRAREIWYWEPLKDDPKPGTGELL